MARRRKPRATKRRHVCVTSVKAGDRIMLLGRAVGFQTVEGRVLALECEHVLSKTVLPKTGRIVTEHRPLLIVEDIPVAPGVASGCLRGAVTLTFSYTRAGRGLEGAEEGQATRRLTLNELRAWAVSAQAGAMPISLLDHLIRGVL